jgi:hypothetical protein
VNATLADCAGDYQRAQRDRLPALIHDVNDALAAVGDWRRAKSCDLRSVREACRRLADCITAAVDFTENPDPGGAG